MGRYTKLLSVFTLAVMITSLSVVASAQWRNSRGTNGSYGNTNNYNLNSTIRNLRDKTRRFEDTLDRELDRSRYDGTRREDQLNNLAKKLKNAAENLDDEYDNSRDFNRSRDEAQRVVSYGSQLNRALSSSRSNRNTSLSSQWRSINQDIRTISQAYRLNYNSRSTRSNRNKGNQNGRSSRNRNGNRNQRGTYNGNGQNNRNLRSTIVNLRNKSSQFEDRMDREKDNNRNGNRYSSNLEKLSDRFHNAVKDLEGDYDDNRDYNDTRDEVNKVLSLGRQIDREISRARVSRSLRSDWSRIQQDLRTLSRAYNQNYNGRRSTSTRISDIWRNFPF